MSRHFADWQAEETGARGAITIFMETPVLNHRRSEAVVIGEQRLYDRLPGPRQFRLAPFDGATMPAADEFRSFEAYDYSRDGFSYWSPEQPTTELLVIELQYRGRSNYHEARILHLSEARREGVTWHLVGCRFARRLDPATCSVPDDAS